MADLKIDVLLLLQSVVPTIQTFWPGIKLTALFFVMCFGIPSEETPVIHKTKLINRSVLVNLPKI